MNVDEEGSEDALGTDLEREETSTDGFNAWGHTRTPMHSPDASFTVGAYPPDGMGKVAIEIPERIDATLVADAEDLRTMAGQLLDAAEAIEECEEADDV